MQWIPACYGHHATVNQTVTNITETPPHAYIHTDPHIQTKGTHTHAHTQTVQTVAEAPSTEAPSVD